MLVRTQCNAFSQVTSKMLWMTGNEYLALYLSFQCHIGNAWRNGYFPPRRRSLILRSDPSMLEISMHVAIFAPRNNQETHPTYRRGKRVSSSELRSPHPSCSTTTLTPLLTHRVPRSASPSARAACHAGRQHNLW